MKGKTVLITGSTSGLGLSTAKALYRQGATVILTSRDDERGKAAVEAVQAEVPCSEKVTGPPKIFLFHVDLSSLKSILAFCGEIKTNFDKIDVLINNAGVMGLPFELSTDRVEMHFAVNALSHFVITLQLLPLLERGADPHILNISSGLYSKVDCMPTRVQLMGETNYDYASRFAYAYSKLCNCLFTIELQRRLRERRSAVRVYALRPGFVRGTELGRATHWLLRMLASPLILMVSKSLEQGTSGIVSVCTASNDELNDGVLYHDGQEEAYSPMVTQANASVFWNTCLEMEDLIVRRNEQFSEEEKSTLLAPRSYI